MGIGESIGWHRNAIMRSIIGIKYWSRRGWCWGCWTKSWKHHLTKAAQNQSIGQGIVYVVVAIIFDIKIRSIHNLSRISRTFSVIFFMHLSRDIEYSKWRSTKEINDYSSNVKIEKYCQRKHLCCIKHLTHKLFFIDKIK